MPSGEDEVAVRSSGINTTRYKLLAFCLSGFFAGIAGGLYAHIMRTAGPSTLEVALSFQIVIWAVFGGIVSIYGPIAGVFILFPLLEFLRIVPKIRMLLFAFIVLVTLLYMPQGLIPWLRDKIEKECPRCKIRNVATRKTMPHLYCGVGLKGCCELRVARFGSTVKPNEIDGFLTVRIGHECQRGLCSETLAKNTTLKAYLKK